MTSTNRDRVNGVESLRPSRYDRAAGLLISTLILSSTSVAVLVFLWLGTRIDAPRIPREVTFGGAADETIGSEPGEFELPQLSELSQVAISAPTVELSTLLSSESIAAVGQIEIEGPPGDTRDIGPRLPPDDVPRWERWEIRYEASSVTGYSRQLDFFGIELGAVGRTPLVDYASHFTNVTPTTRAGNGSDEKRLYMSWRGGRLQAMDRKLLERAGIDVVGRTLLQFYPASAEDTLARVELEHTKDGRVDQLRKTVFGVRPADDGYEFFIIEQR